VPKEFTITLAVASDLHCHDDAKATPVESYLLAGALRNPVGQHPVQSLIELLKGKALKANALICPGDLSNRICSKGMMQAWDHLREIGRELKCQQLLTTLGNHDVDCLKKHDADSFKIPQSLHPDFPILIDSEKDCFWSRGFYFSLDSSCGADFVVLNTVVTHNNEPSAKRGTFEHHHIEGLRAALAQRKMDIYDKMDVPHRIAVMHHHPIIHSFVDHGSGDVLQFGDQILSVLAEYGFHLVIHGHRHFPRITRHNSGGVEQMIFAAGSFSAYLQKLSSVTRNLFHIISLTTQSSGLPLTGQIRSWEYNYGLGWRPSTAQSASLPHLAGFKVPVQNIDLNRLCHQCDIAPGEQLRAEEILAAFPELQMMLPAELTLVQSELLKLGYKLIISPTGSIEVCGRISSM